MQIKLLHKLQQTIVDVEPSLSVRDLKVQNLIVFCRAGEHSAEKRARVSGPSGRVERHTNESAEASVIKSASLRFRD